MMRTRVAMIDVTASILSALLCMTGCERRQRGDDMPRQAESSEKTSDKDIVSAKPAKEEDVNSLIASASTVLINEGSNRGEYIERICSSIDKIPDAQAKCRYFKSLCDNALSMRFDSVGDIHAKNEDERWEVNRRLGLVYASLEKLVDNVQMRMMQNNAPLQEQFEPMFRFYEVMREEAIRTGKKENRGYPWKLNDIERMYGLCLKTGRFSDSDLSSVRERFLHLAGRPIRTLEQVEADLRSERARTPRGGCGSSRKAPRVTDSRR